MASDPANEAPDGGTAPASFVAEHMVANQLRDVLDVGPRQREAREYCVGQLRTLLVVTDEVSVGERRRLADVVQKRREAQTLIVGVDGRRRIERGQGVAPQVVTGDLVLG